MLANGISQIYQRRKPAFGANYEIVSKVLWNYPDPEKTLIRLVHREIRQGQYKSATDTAINVHNVHLDYLSKTSGTSSTDTLYHKESEWGDKLQNFAYSIGSAYLERMRLVSDSSKNNPDKIKNVKESVLRYISSVHASLTTKNQEKITPELH